jgi:hypothetical protein
MCGWRRCNQLAHPNAVSTACTCNSPHHAPQVAYRLESGAILDELRCFYSRTSLQEDVLGLPLTFTVNPASQRVDYIQAHPYLLSVTAFKAGVRRTPERVSVQSAISVC